MRLPNSRTTQDTHPTCPWPLVTPEPLQHPGGVFRSREFPRPTWQPASPRHRLHPLAPGCNPDSFSACIEVDRPASENPSSPTALEANPCRADLSAIGQGRAARSTNITYHRARKPRTGNLARMATMSSRREHRSRTGGPPSMSAKAISGIVPEITPTTTASTIMVRLTSIGMSETSPRWTTGSPRKRISLTRRTRPAREKVAVENWSRWERPNPTVQIGILCRSLE